MGRKALLITFGSLFYMSVFADVNKTGSCGKNARYMLDNSSATLTITGSGSMDNYDEDADFGGKIAPWRNLNFKNVVIESDITSIGDNAFYGCNNIMSLIIEDGVEEIGKHAFSGCTGLDSLFIPQSVKNIYENPFAGCSNLESIVVDSWNTEYDSRYNCNAIIRTGLEELKVGCKNTFIPNGVKELGKECFKECIGLLSVNIPEGVESLRSDCFCDCSGLTSVTIPSTVNHISYFENYGGNNFAGCEKLSSIIIDNGNKKYDSRNNCNAIIDTESNILITGCSRTIIPNDVSIARGAFLGSGIVSVKIPDGIKTIPEETFLDCKSLKSVTLPNSVDYIGTSAFEGCQSLLTIAIPGSVKHVGQEVFRNCQNLSTVDLSEGLEEISQLAFESCTNLRSISLPNSLKFIYYGAFKGCKSLTSIDIPNLVEGIAMYTFQDCSSLKDVVIGNNVKEIAESSFSGCISLENVTFGNSLEYIGWGAFAHCENLKEIVMGDNVKTIGHFAFAYCYNLESITVGNSLSKMGIQIIFDCWIKTFTIYATEPPMIEPDTFDNLNWNGRYIMHHPDFYVPKESIDSYREKWTSMMDSPSEANPLGAKKSQQGGGLRFYPIGTTSINNVHKIEKELDEYFDMKGQRLAKPLRKGVYIQNGKKVLVK